MIWGVIYVKSKLGVSENAQLICVKSFAAAVVSELDTNCRNLLPVNDVPE